jgi:hypothetical protein
MKIRFKKNRLYINLILGLVWTGLGVFSLLEDESLTTPESSAKGKLMIETTASYVVTSFDDKTISTGASDEVQVDSYANNVGIETVADSILDFTEGNPFSEGTGY